MTKLRPTKPQLAALQSAKDKGTIRTCHYAGWDTHEVNPRTITACIKKGWLRHVHIDGSCSLWALTKAGQRMLAP